LRILLGLSFILAALSASSASAVVSVVVSPSTASLPANGSQQFSAKVFGSTNQTVRWEVNGVPGGAPSIGVISDAGFYTAPPDAPKLFNVKVEAEPAAAPASPGGASVSVAAGTKTGTSYYLSPTGKDSGPGTQAEPWATFKHALATVPAGSQILVEGDTNHPYHELIAINRSGSATAGFLSIEAAPGASPAIDGTGLGIPNQENGLVTIANQNWVRVKGLELRNYTSSTTDEPIGIYIVGAGSHIEILDNHIHAIGETLKTSAGNALGILVSGEAEASINWLTIDGNQLDHLTLGFSESLSLTGNVEKWQVANNTIHDNNNIGVNIEGFFGTDVVDPALDQARRGLVAGNVVYNISSINNPAYGCYCADGLYVDGGTLVTLQNNLVYDSDYGIELASEVPGKSTTWAWAHDNIIHNNKVAGVTIGGSDPKAHGGTTNCSIVNNTFYFDDSTQSGEGEFQVQNHASDNVVFNNVFFANTNGIFVYYGVNGGSPGHFNHNLYFSAGDASGDPWIWLNKNYATLGDFQSASGEDKQSKQANPDFVSAASDNFAIPTTSPAVALGAFLGLSYNGLIDYAGHPRRISGTIDAGALEH